MTECEICKKDAKYFTEMYNPDTGVCDMHWLCKEHQSQMYNIFTRSLNCVKYLNMPKPNNLALTHHFCDCGSLLVATKKGNWKCPKCGKKFNKV